MGIGWRGPLGSSPRGRMSREYAGQKRGKTAQKGAAERNQKLNKGRGESTLEILYDAKPRPDEIINRESIKLFSNAENEDDSKTIGTRHFSHIIKNNLFLRGFVVNSIRRQLRFCKLRRSRLKVRGRRSDTDSKGWLRLRRFSAFLPIPFLWPFLRCFRNNNRRRWRDWARPIGWTAGDGDELSRTSAWKKEKLFRNPHGTANLRISWRLTPS